MIRFLLAAVVAIAAIAAAALGMGMTGKGMQDANAAQGTAAAHRSEASGNVMTRSLEGAATWVNSAPLTASQLRGKVVLVDFWTYSCINCIRTLPYVRAWAEKYRDAGLVVVGVHAPEFGFERDLENVKAAIRRFNIDFPVVLDNDHRIWRDFENRFWPAYYLVDATGRIRYRLYGEGNYDQMERAIQSLVAERGEASIDTALVTPGAQDEQMAPAPEAARSAETYLGHERAANFRSPEGLQKDIARSYSVSGLALNQWGLGGEWTVNAERATVNRAGGSIALQFSARDLHLVMGPGSGRKPIRFQVRVDGRAPGADRGADIDENGYGVVTEARLHQLVRQAGGSRERRFEIRFLDPGAEAYAFTFG